LHADEQRLRDLAVGVALRGEGGDLALGRRQALLGCAAADALELAAGLLRPQRCAEPVEGRECALQRFARRSPLLRAPLDRALDEQRAGELERDRQTLVLAQRLLGRGERRVEITRRRAQERPAARRGRGRPRMVELAGARLELVQYLARPLELAEGHERLDQV